MKLSHTTLLAILASAAFTTAVPTVTNQESSSSIVKREDIKEILAVLSELKSLKQKRDAGVEGEDLIDIERREDNVLTNLISALSNSGLLGTLYDDLASNSELKSSSLAIIKAAVKEAVVQGPTLLKAIYNSGLIQDLYKGIVNDDDLKSSLLAAGKSLFGTALNIVETYIKGKTSDSDSTDTATTVATATSSATAKRSVVADKRNAAIDLYALDDLEKRDVSDIISYVISAIKDSGLVSSLINKFLADPETAISYLTSALKKGLVLVEDIFDWAKDNGLLDSAISWLEESDNSIVSTLGKFLASALEDGTVSSDDIDGASSTTTTAVTYATTTAAAAAVTGTSTDDDLSFLSKYAEAGATTLVKRMAY